MHSYCSWLYIIYYISGTYIFDKLKPISHKLVSFYLLQLHCEAFYFFFSRSKVCWKDIARGGPWGGGGIWMYCASRDLPYTMPTTMAAVNIALFLKIKTKQKKNVFRSIREKKWTITNYIIRVYFSFYKDHLSIFFFLLYKFGSIKESWGKKMM